MSQENKAPTEYQLEKEESEPKEYSKKIGDYILLEQIGQGTFSKVTKAFHTISEQIVAVKILDKQKIEDEIDIERINREINILRNINHPNICQMYETYTTIHNYYLMMEYLEGGNLFDYIKEKNYLSEHKACYFFRQLISVMEYLYLLGISHRDIKPENILLNKEHTQIKVIDFGLSNYSIEHELLKSSCGSPCYASPEMLSGRPYSGLGTDMWSGGVVLYSMLVGGLPFDDVKIENLYQQIKEGKFFIPSTLSLEAIDLLKKILRVDPEKRITIEELKQHPWFNIEKNIIYKGVNIFDENLPCDINVVKYVINNYFKNKNISLNAFIQMVKRYACNKYTATYYLVKKNILKKDDLLDYQRSEEKNKVKNKNINIIENSKIIEKKKIEKENIIIDKNEFINNKKINEIKKDKIDKKEKQNLHLKNNEIIINSKNFRNISENIYDNDDAGVVSKLKNNYIYLITSEDQVNKIAKENIDKKEDKNIEKKKMNIKNKKKINILSNNLIDKQKIKKKNLKDIILESQKKNEAKKNMKKLEKKNNCLKLGLSLLNIKNINYRKKINECITERNITEKNDYFKNINKIYYNINKGCIKNKGKQNEKLKTYLDKIISPKKGDINFYEFNSLSNKETQGKINYKKKYITSANNNGNMIVNINNNNYINNSMNRNNYKSLSLENSMFKTHEIKINLKSSKKELKYSISPNIKKIFKKKENKNNDNTHFEFDLFSNKMNNIYKFKQRNTISPTNTIHIKNNRMPNLTKFNTNIFKIYNNNKRINLSALNTIINNSAQNAYFNNNSSYNKKNKKDNRTDKMKEIIINHKKGKSLYNSNNTIFNYLNETKKNKNPKKNLYSVFRYQLNDNSENKELNMHSIYSNTLINDTSSFKKNKNNSNNITISYSKEKAKKSKIMNKYNIQKRPLTNKNNDLFLNKLKKNELIISSRNSKIKNRNFDKNNDYKIGLTHSNSISKYIITLNNQSIQNKNNIKKFYKKKA